MKKKILALILLSAMVFAFVSCGNKNETEEVSEPKPSETVDDIEEETKSTDLTGEWDGVTEDGRIIKTTITDDDVTVDFLTKEETPETQEELEETETTDTNTEEDKSNDNAEAESDESLDNKYGETSALEKETYWVGTYTAPDTAIDTFYTWSSERIDDAEMTSTEDAIDFTWYAGGADRSDSASDDASAVNAPCITFTETDASTGEEVTYTMTQSSTDSAADDASAETTPSASGTDSAAESSDAAPSASASDDAPSVSAKSSESASPSSSASGSSESTASPSASASSNAGSDTASSDSGASSGSTGGASGSDTASSGNSSGTASSGSSGSASSGNSSGSASSGNSSGNASSGSASSQHTHTYNAGVVTQQATCSTAGVKTYTCTTCGATKTESVPATGHNWQAVYKTVHHDEVGHWETTNVQDYRYVCTWCGFYTVDVTGMSSSNEISYMRVHFDNAHGGAGNYTVKLVDVGTTSTWVVDSAGYDEQVLDHYVCSNCNATK